MKVDSELEEKALAAIERKGMLSGGERVVVSVSGGPDSVALLMLLARISDEFHLKINVFHLDHMFRGEESREDARYTGELARRVGVPARLAKVDLPGLLDEEGSSPQDLARKVRSRELGAYADEVGADRIAVGHTADDQVETFLMRVVQGAGLSGLGAIPAVSGRLIRPLIGVWRSEVEEYLEGMRIEPRLDSSNLKPVYLRNRIRHRLIPFLCEEYGPGVKEVILREVESLAADREFVDGRAEEAFRDLAVLSDGEIRIGIGAMGERESAIRRRVIREAWRRISPESPNLSWQHLSDIELKVAGGRSGSRMDLPGPVIVENEYGYLVFRSTGEGPRLRGPASLDIPGCALTPDSRQVIVADRLDRNSVVFQDDPSIEFVRPDISVPLEVRTAREGDRFHPLGAEGAKKVSDYYKDVKLPRKKRSTCPIVTSDGEVVWIVGHRLDGRYRLADEDQSAVRLRLLPLDAYYGSGSLTDQGGD